MISFTSYIKNTFYNDIYKASEEYFLEHLEDLGVIDNDDDEVEVTDIEVMYVYAGNREDDEIDEAGQKLASHNKKTSNSNLIYSPYSGQ